MHPPKSKESKTMLQLLCFAIFQTKTSVRNCDECVV